MATVLELRASATRFYVRSGTALRLQPSCSMSRGVLHQVAIAAVAGLLCVAAGGCARAAESEAPTIPASPPDDKALEQRLAGIFSEIEGLAHLRVRVRNGVVHLAGTTETVARERLALDLADRLEGVVHIDNDIVQEARLLERFAPALRRLGRASRTAITMLPLLITAIAVLAASVFLARLLGRWRHPFHRLGVRKLTGNLIRSALRALLVAVGIWLALQILGLVPNAGAVLGALGLVALLGSLAFRDWVQNYMPGVLLGLHPPFSTGDLVRIGEREGRVVRITPSATVLLSTDGEEVRVPNAALFREPLINFSHHPRRRLRFIVELSPRADLRDARELGRRALLGVPGVLDEPPPFMRTRSLERDTIEIEYFAWVDQERTDFRTAESRARSVVFEALTRHRVPRPSDTLTLQFAEGDAEERDRAFLDEQLVHARSADERDLLEEGRRPRRSSPNPREERRS